MDGRGACIRTDLGRRTLRSVLNALTDGRILPNRVHMGMLLVANILLCLAVEGVSRGGVCQRELSRH